MSKIDIQKINRIQNFPIERVLSLLGITINNRGSFACPYHSDANPTMKVIKAKNKCKCLECGQEASAIDLVMRYLGYYDPNEAIEYLLDQSNITSAACMPGNRDQDLINAKVNLTKRTKILTEFYWAFATDVPMKIQKLLIKRYRIDSSFFNKEYMGWLDLDTQHIIYSLLQQWSREDLEEVGLLKNMQDGDESFLFHEHRLIFPYFDFRPFYCEKKIRGHKLVQYIKGVDLDELAAPKYVGTDIEDFWLYNMNNVDWTKKILICEGVVNVLSVLSNSKIYTTVGVNQINIKPEFVNYFKQADVTIAFNHRLAGKDEKQQEVSSAYHKNIQKVSDLFLETVNHTPNIMKTSIGVELVEYFKRYRRYS